MRYGHRLVLASALSAVLAGTNRTSCASQSVDQSGARLTVRPHAVREPFESGIHRLGLDGQRDGLLVIPTIRSPGGALPLAVVFHGAGGSAAGALQSVQAAAEEAGVVLLIPDSRAATWDVLSGGYGPDVRFLEEALEFAFDHSEIDARRMAVSGFSDGASYALSIGLTNGDAFSHVFAFSPGFMSPTEYTGRPDISVWHGTRDRILPIASTSRRIVARLKERGYAVDYTEFDGPHTVLREAQRVAMMKLAGRTRSLPDSAARALDASADARGRQSRTTEQRRGTKADPP